MTLSANQLKAIVPFIQSTRLQEVLPWLNKYMAVYQINTYERVCAFIAQLAHESASFRYTEEIASGEAYEGRKDLGNLYPGDGKRFKGRGFIQITGRANYKECSISLFEDLRLIENPEILEEIEYAVKSACWFWSKKGLNVIADQPNTWAKERKGKTYDKFEWITLLINGGQNGIADRKEFYKRAKATLK